MILKFFMAALSLAVTLPSHAQIFRLNYTPDPAMSALVAGKLEGEIKKIQDDINGDLPGADSPDRLMEGMANSSIMAGKGIGSDYASGMKVMLIGAGVGAAVDLEKNKSADTDLSGAGVQAGLILGTKLSWMDTKYIFGLETDRISAFVNFFNYDLEQKTGDTDAKVGLTSYGVHFSYDWIKGRGNKLFGWGGVKIHTGYEYNKTRLEFNSTIKKNLDYTNSGIGYTANLNATPNAVIDVASHSIPLEISSSIQFLYFISMYTGLGVDYNSGKATGKGDLNSSSSNVNCTPAGTPGACSAGGSAGTIDTSANINGKGEANPFLFRGFAGLQFNLPFIRIFGQVDKAFGNELIAASTGIRFVY